MSSKLIPLWLGLAAIAVFSTALVITGAVYLGINPRTEQATATIVQVVTCLAGNSFLRYGWYGCRMQVSFADRAGTDHGNVTLYADMPDVPTVGDQLEVSFDPTNVGDVIRTDDYSNGVNYVWRGGWFLGLGATALAILLVAILYCIVYKRWRRKSLYTFESRQTDAAQL